MAAYEFLYQEDLYQLNDSILILVDKPWEEIAEEDKTLLNKILGAVKLTMDKVQVLHRTNISLQEVMTFQPSKIISFGTKLQEINEFYTVVNHQGISFISSEALSSLTDISKKSLWAALKQLFQ
jgi:hypothetical protein